AASPVTPDGEDLSSLLSDPRLADNAIQSFTALEQFLADSSKRLLDRYDVLFDRESLDRELAEETQAIDVGPEGERLNRHRGAALRQMHQAVNLFLKVRTARREGVLEPLAPPKLQPAAPVAHTLGRPMFHDVYPGGTLARMQAARDERSAALRDAMVTRSV